MPNEKPDDELKASRLIEEMEKSLHNLEKSLGMDHPAVAKVLDSYARLLRQNKIRHLDAVNMEARARAIRAKQNQKEAEAQSRGLETAVQEQSRITVTHLRIITWSISLIVLSGLCWGLVDFMNKSSRQLTRHTRASRPYGSQSENPQPAGLPSGSDTSAASSDTSAASSDTSATSSDTSATSSNTSATRSDTATNPTGKASPGAGDNNAGNAKADGQSRPDSNTQGGDNNASADTTATRNNVNVLELAQKIIKIKNLARDELAAGLAAEKDKDYKKATEAYVVVIKAAQSAPSEIGRPVYSEEIARCFEGYARMADLESHPEIAREWQQAAADLRKHLD
jgi:cytoskeletal protein RodZ